MRPRQGRERGAMKAGAPSWGYGQRNKENNIFLIVSLGAFP